MICNKLRDRLNRTRSAVGTILKQSIVCKFYLHCTDNGVTEIKINAFYSIYLQHNTFTSTTNKIVPRLFTFTQNCFSQYQSPMKLFVWHQTFGLHKDISDGALMGKHLSKQKYYEK